ncbi:cell division protein FtsZ [Pseudomonadota bacterium]
MKMFELVENYTPSANIKVIGVGGGGGNAVAQMIDASIEGVEFIAANTDAQALRQFKGKTILQIGSSVTKGLGAGANPEVGRQAALEDRDHIIEMLAGADMVFITAGMGGGTGTGAAPVIAQAAKEQGILTVAVVTKPFHFEARRRMSIAEKGIEELAAHCDSLITIPNAKLADVLGGETLLLNAFKAANDVLQGAVQGIAELITRPGLINVDFADVRTVMSEMGMAMMGAGQSSGDDRAIMAAQAAIGSPLLEDINLSGACGILVNITAGTNLTMKEFEEVGGTVSDLASEDATVVMGTVIDPDMGDDLRVTVVATGLGEPRVSKAFREQPIRLVANGTTGRNDGSGLDELAVEEINRDRDQRIANVENKDLFERQKDIDYLDIPSFLRTQAD